MSKAILISYKTRQKIKMDMKYKSKDNTCKIVKETLSRLKLKLLMFRGDKMELPSLQLLISYKREDM